MSDGPHTDADVARQIGVTPRTLKRWVDSGVVPKDGTWTPAAIAHARIVARLRERGHTLRQIAAATEAGRLSFAYIEDLLPTEDGSYSVRDASRETGLEPALIERIFSTMGLNQAAMTRIGEDDLQLLRYVAAVLAAASRSSRSCSCCASTGRRSRRWPTPRCGSSTSTSTSR